MRVCVVHATRFGFEARNPPPDADPATVQTEAATGTCTVAFVAVEPGDTTGVGRAAARAVADVREQLGTAATAVVPCPALSETPASVETAAGVLDALTDTLDGTVHRVPMEWDVAFDVETKGHPHAIQQFQFDAPAEYDSEWLVATPAGDLRDADEAAVPDVAGDRDREPSAGREVVSTGQAMGLWRVENGRGSLLPAGVVVRDLLLGWLTDRTRSVGAVPVGGGAEAALAPEATRADTALPVRVFDPRGEDASGDDGRWFPGATAPELAAVVQEEDVLAEVCRQVALVHGILGEFDLSGQPVVRVTGPLRDDAERWLAGLGPLFDRPVPVEYGAGGDEEVRVGFEVRDETGAVLVAPTVSVPRAADDEREENASSGSRRVVRALPLGRVEQFAAALVDRGDVDESGWPTWLAPTQLRLVPIEPERHRDHCAELANSVGGCGVRVDVDDRDLPLRERLSAARQAGVPYYAVVGDDERERDLLRVAVPGDRRERPFVPADLRERIVEEATGYPANASALPPFLSAYPPTLRGEGGAGHL